jgi:hypothetical protein
VRGWASSSLRSLLLGRNPLTRRHGSHINCNDGLRALVVVIRSGAPLTELDISKANLDADNLRSLGQALDGHSTELVEVNISGNSKLRDESLRTETKLMLGDDVNLIWSETTIESDFRFGIAQKLHDKAAAVAKAKKKARMVRLACHSFNLQAHGKRKLKVNSSYLFKFAGTDDAAEETRLAMGSRYEGRSRVC